MMTGNQLFRCINVGHVQMILWCWWTSSWFTPCRPRLPVINVMFSFNSRDRVRQRVGVTIKGKNVAATLHGHRWSKHFCMAAQVTGRLTIEVVPEVTTVTNKNREALRRMTVMCQHKPCVHCRNFTQWPQTFEGTAFHPLGEGSTISPWNIIIPLEMSLLRG